MIKMKSKILEKIALIRVVAVAQYGFTLKVRPVMLQFSFYIYYLRVELILPCRFCRVKVFISHRLIVNYSTAINPSTRNKKV